VPTVETGRDGSRNALVRFGFLSGAGLERALRGDEVGKTYTFAVQVSGVGGPAVARLAVDQSGRDARSAVREPDVRVPDGEWTELHATFLVERPFQDGWTAYLSCEQEGGRLNVDAFRLYEGEYVPSAAPVQEDAAAGPGDPFRSANPESEAASWTFSHMEQHNLRRTYRRWSFLVTRLLANMGAAEPTPVLAQFHKPVDATKAEKRWLDGLYVDVPIEWDDPYRYFCW
jgi:hypothetical protein